ncbi:MAG: hypothetical protein M3548_22965 [Actinomycetota bacterium]|nr:hypothetical protein [Actinomycetota bacterium]
MGISLATTRSGRPAIGSGDSGGDVMTFERSEAARTPDHLTAAPPRGAATALTFEREWSPRASYDVVAWPSRIAEDAA